MNVLKATQRNPPLEIIWKMVKSVRSCFECVFSQIIRLLQGCSITTSKIALKRWTDGPHNVKTLRKCSENQCCRACSCYSNECWSISVTSTQNCFRSCSIQSIPGKQIGLLYVCWPNLGCYGGTQRGIAPLPRDAGMFDLGFSSKARQENSTST